ncbi:MAG: DHH family phosphoesterase [Candidatus Nanoarchaeia archaeon]
MDNYETFVNYVNDIVAKFKNLENLKEEPIKLISHRDADGICSAAIASAAFKREGLKFSISTVKQLTKKKLEELKNEDYKVYFFTDLGSGSIHFMKEILKEKIIFILDHHIIDKELLKENSENIFIVNPHLFDIDGSFEVSGAGVTYIFFKNLNEKNIDLAHLALIGALGDIQAYDTNEYNEDKFSYLNQRILEDAISVKKIKVERGLRMFGAQTKPLHRLLEYSTDPYIPGITGSEENASQLLNELGIPAKNPENKFRRLCDLSDEEIKKLTTAIILKRMGSEKNPDDVLGDIYTLVDEAEDSVTRNAKEFATLLNACSKMGKPSLGIGVCLNDSISKEKANLLLLDYKKEIIKALNWFYSKRKTETIQEGPGYVLINSEDNLKDTMIGTLTSMITKSNLYPNGTIIMTVGHTLDGCLKASIRGIDTKKDLRKLVESISEKLPLKDAEFGGHGEAAGCILSLEQEKDFLSTAIQVLKEAK